MVQPKDFARILKAVPRLVHFPVKQLWIAYDAEADVLYLSFSNRNAPPTANCVTTESSCIAVERRWWD